MKVLITTDLYKPQINGVVTSVLNLYDGLKKLGVDVKILTLSKSFTSYKDGDVYYVKSFPLKLYPDLRASVNISDKILRELIHWKPDIIHTQCEFSTLLFAKLIATFSKCPIVHTYHTLYEYYIGYLLKHEAFGEKFVRVLVKTLLKNTQAIIAPTQKVKRNLERFNLNKIIKVIPTGLDFTNSNLEFTNFEREALLKKMNIDKNDFIMISLGRVAKEKNIDELIDYFKTFNNEKISFLVVGGGPHLETLKNYVKDNNVEKIYFTGMVKPDDIHKYYKSADVFVCASESETQGLTYFEAISNGLPLICKKDECLSEILIDGETGFYFTNREEFINSINNLRFDGKLLKNLSENAKEVSKSYSKEYFAKSCLELYKEILMDFKYIPIPIRELYRFRDFTKKAGRKIRNKLKK